MPLLLAELNILYIIRHIRASEKERHHLETLGFIPGVQLMVLSKFNGYLLVSIKGSRVGIDRNLAKRIII